MRSTALSSSAAISAFWTRELLGDATLGLLAPALEFLGQRDQQRVEALLERSERLRRRPRELLRGGAGEHEPTEVVQGSRDPGQLVVQTVRPQSERLEPLLRQREDGLDALPLVVRCGRLVDGLGRLLDGLRAEDRFGGRERSLLGGAGQRLLLPPSTEAPHHPGPGLGHLDRGGGAPRGSARRGRGGNRRRRQRRRRRVGEVGRLLSRLGEGLRIVLTGQIKERLGGRIGGEERLGDLGGATTAAPMPAVRMELVHHPAGVLVLNRRALLPVVCRHLDRLPPVIPPCDPRARAHGPRAREART